jgi:CDP-diacylglycerol--serine O-phosphatidyltransferase
VKKIAVIPTLLTLGNAVCGFAAIAYASKIDNSGATDHFFAVAGWLLIAAMIFDALDGSVARLSKTSSRFGGELDSLCDGISFGLAPAFLLLKMGPGVEPRPFLHQVLAGIAALYMACALLRLARFNVEALAESAGSKKFRGLPSPAAAGCIASLAILREGLAGLPIGLDAALVHGVVEAWATLGALAVALLMVSRVPYPHLTKSIIRGRRHFNHLLQILVAAFIIALIRELALVLIFWIYALGFFFRHLVVRALKDSALPAPVTGMDDSPRLNPP